ncbi:unnamed protein product [Cuscuta campestris]|uniref:Uncharacterized protein n=1 Tax=Cuscuta campestris TaxID=132261 RepID=A0A484KNY8_9ASTE|nr:unnamed protein product [Cuscuta campestris]
MEDNDIDSIIEELRLENELYAQSLALNPTIPRFEFSLSDFEYIPIHPAISIASQASLPQPKVPYPISNPTSTPSSLPINPPTLPYPPPYFNGLYVGWPQAYPTPNPYYLAPYPYYPPQTFPCNPYQSGEVVGSKKEDTPVEEYLEIVIDKGEEPLVLGTMQPEVKEVSDILFELVVEESDLGEIMEEPLGDEPEHLFLEAPPEQSMKIKGGLSVDSSLYAFERATLCTHPHLEGQTPFLRLAFFPITNDSLESATVDYPKLCLFSEDPPSRVAQLEEKLKKGEEHNRELNVVIMRQTDKMAKLSKMAGVVGAENLQLKEENTQLMEEVSRLKGIVELKDRELPDRARQWMENLEDATRVFTPPPPENDDEILQAALPGAHW